MRGASLVRLTAMANLPCGLAWVGGHLATLGREVAVEDRAPGAPRWGRGLGDV